MSLMNVLSGKPSFVTGIFFQESPPFVVTWIIPSSVPAYIKPSLTGDSDTDAVSYTHLRAHET